MSTLPKNLSALANLIEQRAKELGCAFEEVATKVLEGLLEGAEAKRIAEQNSEGDHTKEAISYVKHH